MDMQKKNGENMKNFDPYKRTILFCASIINILLMSAVFAAIWYCHYSDTMYIVRFYRKGHYLVIALYAIILFFFSNTYGSLRIGQNRRIEVLLSQYLSILLTNIIGSAIKNCVNAEIRAFSVPCKKDGIGKCIMCPIATYISGTNKIIEVTSKDLIGTHLGETAPKTQAVIETALDGILFIDKVIDEPKKEKKK